MAAIALRSTLRTPGGRPWGLCSRPASLRNADLWDANLSGADLSNADLIRANLRNAKLSNAYLGGAEGIKNEELEQQAKSLEGATMPNGQKYEEWLKSRGQENSGS
jgi:uncharacterized protein YjbI with pentapeptide repeats